MKLYLVNDNFSSTTPTVESQRCPATAALPRHSRDTPRIELVQKVKAKLREDVLESEQAWRELKVSEGGEGMLIMEATWIMENQRAAA